MTDCLSEDDDEEHHPVHLIEGIVRSCTLGAEEKLCQTNPESVHIPDIHYPVPRIVPDDTTAISPVFQDRCSYGLMGL